MAGWSAKASSYDYYAEAQLHDGTLKLDDYQVLAVSVHPEYWTRDMYFKLKQWVFERGGRLMYLGGNGLNCEVRLSDDATLRCLSHDDSIDPRQVTNRGCIGPLSLKPTFWEWCSPTRGS